MDLPGVGNFDHLVVSASFNSLMLTSEIKHLILCKLTVWYVTSGLHEIKENGGVYWLYSRKTEIEVSSPRRLWLHPICCSLPALQ